MYMWTEPFIIQDRHAALTNMPLDIHDTASRIETFEITMEHISCWKWCWLNRIFSLSDNQQDNEALQSFLFLEINSYNYCSLGWYTFSTWISGWLSHDLAFHKAHEIGCPYIACLWRDNGYQSFVLQWAVLWRFQTVNRSKTSFRWLIGCTKWLCTYIIVFWSCAVVRKNGIY